MKKILFALLAAVLLFMTSCDSGTASVGEGKSIAGYSAGNKAVDYSFQYPEEWELDRNDGVIGIRFDRNTSDGLAEYSSISVMVFSDEDNQAVRDYWNSYVEQIKSIYKDYELIDESEVSLDETVALRVKYRGSFDEKAYITEQVLCVRNGSVYHITLTATDADYESSVAAFQTVITTFDFN